MDFKNYTSQQILNDKDVLKNFLSLYSEKTGEQNLNASCLSCIQNYKNKLYYIMETKDKDYILNPKYEGIYFNGDYLRNDNLTNERAKEFIKLKVTEEMPITEWFVKYPKENVIKETENIITERKNKK